MNGFSVGEYVSYFSYGAIRYGHIQRFTRGKNGGGIVWLTNGKWLHIESIYKAFTL